MTAPIGSTPYEILSDATAQHLTVAQAARDHVYNSPAEALDALLGASLSLAAAHEQARVGTGLIGSASLELDPDEAQMVARLLRYERDFLGQLDPARERAAAIRSRLTSSVAGRARAIEARKERSGG